MNDKKGILQKMREDPEIGPLLERDTEHQKKITDVQVFVAVAALLLLGGKVGCESMAEYMTKPVKAAVAECLDKCSEDGNTDCEFIFPSDGVVRDPEFVRRMGVAQCANEVLGEQGREAITTTIDVELVEKDRAEVYRSSL